MSFAESKKNTSAGAEMIRSVAIDLSGSEKVAGDPAETVAIDMGKPVVVKTERVAPDGGFGWAVAVTSFLVTFLVTGFSKSFGIMRSAIVEEFPSSTNLEANWITGVIGCVSLMMSPLTGMCMASFGPGILVAVGYVLCSIGLGISYFANSAVHLIACLGILMGIGSSFVITSAVGCTAKYFTTRKPAAMTIALSGGCIGAIVMPYILRPMLASLGLGLTFVALAGIYLAMALTGLVYANPEGHFIIEAKEVPVEDATTSESTQTVPRPLLERMWNGCVERMALRYIGRPLFIVMACSVFAITMGSPHFIAQISGRARAVGATADNLALFTLLTQLADLCARLVYGMLASKSPLKRSLEYAVALGVAASCAAIAFFCNSFWQLAVLGFIGAFAAGVINIAVPLVLSANHGAKNMSSTLNLVRWCQGISGLIYRGMSPELPSLVNGTPLLLILNTTNLWFAVLMAVVMCLLPTDTM